MKTLLIFGSGLGLGVLFGWFGKPAATGVHADVKTPASLATPTASASQTSDEKTEAGPTSRPSRPDLPKTKTFNLADGVKVIEGKMDPQTEKIMEEFKKRHEEKRAHKLDERVAALRTRLGLTDDQAAKVRAMLEAGEDKGGPGSGMPIDIAKLMNGGESKAERDALDARMAELLSPEQSQKYQEFQQEQRENRVEIATNNEINRLQQSLTLSREQKDQAYQALGEIAQSEDDQPTSKGIDPARMAARKQARMDALRPILTPEQMKAYESQPMQLGSSDMSGAISIQMDSIAAPSGK